METYHELYLNTRARLLPLNERMAALEARYIVMCAAGKTHEELVRDYNLYAGDKVYADVKDMLRRRLEGEPPAYITGSWEFYGLPMVITRDVLIPRVDTEVLAAAAIEKLKSSESADDAAGSRVLDLCTGSGCIGLAIAKNVPNAKVTMADNSEDVLKVARRNASTLGLTVSCVSADALNPPERQLGVFDMIVCNPPYIPSGEIYGLDKSVKDYEPFVALDGGSDGLDFYRAVAKHWKKALKSGGHLLFEVGSGQMESVKLICFREGLAEFEVIRDTGDIDRVLVATLREV
ncbi:MAG: peptide chain release factor N(5)-glutamine methyltransferase [Oscillospiraceae bacterium]|nr:peptide chain release factor N(5)-glutamine methyltransferase [Oscillospiraceae bacterium]